MVIFHSQVSSPEGKSDASPTGYEGKMDQSCDGGGSRLQGVGGYRNNPKSSGTWWLINFKHKLAGG